MQPFFTPMSIETRSFAIIDEEVGPEKPFSGGAWSIARRLVHTTGDFSILDDLVLPDEAIAAGIAALKKGAPIFTDTEMARCGIPLRRLEKTGNMVQSIMAIAEGKERAVRENTTRSRAGILELGERLGGAIVVIGNAPTALIALLEVVDTLKIYPALVVGMPVGFVNAAESKELLLERNDIHSLVIKGRRGGSPLAAATVNALACLLATSDEK